MLEVENTAELAALVGQKLGTSDWLVVDQARIDAFAAATGDHNWFHVDTARAAREFPGGKTIAHGFLTLSLLAELGNQIYRVRQRKRALNYGCNKVRFLSPVPVDSRLRLHQTLLAAERQGEGMRFTFESTMEIAEKARPAMVAETLLIIFD
jgi:acyl dehydratase